MNDGFFAMGGYGFYVWLSYGLSLVVLVVNAVLPKRRERALLAKASARKTQT